MPYAGPETNFIEITGWEGNEGSIGYYMRLPDEFCSPETGFTPSSDGGGSGSDGMCMSGTKPLSKILLMSQGLRIHTSPHTCSGHLNLPHKKGLIEYMLQLSDLGTGLVNPTSYVPPDAMSEPERACFVAFTQPVLSYDSGTFLPLPKDVGEMIDPKGGSPTSFTFNIEVEYEISL